MPAAKKSRKSRKSGKTPKRPLNEYFKKMLEAKRKNADSFKYNGETYVIVVTENITYRKK